jgi:hypothetical protein
MNRLFYIIVGILGIIVGFLLSFVILREDPNVTIKSYCPKGDGTWQVIDSPVEATDGEVYTIVCGDPNNPGVLPPELTPTSTEA